MFVRWGKYGKQRHVRRTVRERERERGAACVSARKKT